ncbi:hypothetical protein ABPG74_012569 [Tetrahymena malaccensis]
MDMFPQMLNFNFQSFVNLNIQNNPDNSQLAIVRYKDKLLFQNFNSVILKQLKISFLPQSQICGLIFQDVADFVIIDNIQMNSLNNSTINCQQLEIDNSFLQIKNLTLNGEDFSNSQYLISAKNTQKVQINIFSQTFLQLQVVILILNINQISISNLTLNNSMLGDQFSILKQNTDIEAIVTNLTLTNNYCIKAVPPNSISTPLFSAGHYTVMLVNITDNVFCNKNMFEAITLFSQPYQIFSFSNISVINNIFYTRTSYLLINIDYSILLNPSHNFILQNSNFIKNSISMSSQNDIATSSFVQAAKLKNFSISNVSLIDHYQISLLKVQQAELVNITNFNCSNCKQYQSKQQLGQTAGCLYINEVKTLNMTQILCNYKQTYDVSLFQIDNIDYKQSQISIENSNFTNLQLYQTQMNSYVNPIQVSSSFNLSLQIQSCIFQNNYLSSIPISITYSTTGIWVQNFVGLVILKNVTYENSSSNSLYNNMHIQSQSLKIFNLTSKKSSFRQLNPQDTLFKQNGGVLNAIVNQLEILDSSFAQSTSQKGSFLYIQSFGNNLNISLLNTDFSEGYGLLDGGALFIDTQGNLINFSCKNCSFVNVYTFYQLSSSIAIQYNLAMQNKNQSYFHFDGGQIKNTLGISDNYFIQVQLSKLLFENVKNIKYEEFKSDSQAFQEFQSHPSKQQSTLFNLQDSQIQILNCGISDLNLINKQQQLPVIIKSSNSNIFINNTVIQNCLFAKSFINLQGSSIILDNTIIQNVNQVKDFRLMQKQINIEQPNNQENSLIVAKASTVQILNLSKFQQINCQKCNGGGISLINGNINIQDSVFSQIESLFGGAIFINDATGKNFIDNTKFLSCSSSFDGGALYAYLQNVNAINITISECQFENNISINGRGGAIFISSSSLNPTNIFSFVSNTNFIQNTAQIGGAIFQQNISTIISHTSFEQNQAIIFGNDLQSYATKLSINNVQHFLKLSNSQIVNGQIEVNSFRSGDILSKISFQFLNDKDEVVTPATQEELNQFNVQVRIDPQAENRNNYQINGNQQVNIDHNSQLFTFQQLTLIGKPNSSVVIQFFSNQLFPLNQKTNKYDQNYTFDLKINFRNCISGEQVKEFNSLVQCEICQKGQFSLNELQCQNCPQNAQCLGGNKIITDYGYWRKSSNTSLIVQCENQESNCVGGEFGNFICKKGYIGALCEECDIYGEFWESSYSKSTRYSCYNCSTYQLNILLILFLAGWTMFSMLVSIKGNNNYAKIHVAQLTILLAVSKKQKSLNSQTIETTKNILNKQQTHQTQKTSTSLSNRNQKSNNNKVINKDYITVQMKQSTYIKLFNNYIQIISSIATFNLSIPSGPFQFPSIMGQPVKQSISSVECFLVKIDTEVPIIYLKLIFSQILPFIYLIIFISGYFKKYVKKQDEKKKQINPEVKKKFQKIFQRYLNYSDNEKKAFFINVFEKQLANHRGVFKNSERLKSEVISSMSNSNQLLSESDKRSFNSDLSIKFEQQRNQVKQSRFLSLTDCNIKQTLKPTIVNLETFGEQSPPRTQNNLEQSFSDNTNMKTEKEITYE